MKIIKPAVLLAASMLLLSSCASVPEAEIKAPEKEVTKTTADYPLSESLTTSNKIWSVEELKNVLEDSETVEGDIEGAPTLYISNNSCEVSAEIALDEEQENYIVDSLYDTQYETYNNLIEGETVKKQYISEAATSEDDTLEIFTVEYENSDEGSQGVVATRALLTESDSRATATIRYSCGSAENFDESLFPTVLERIHFLAK